MRKIQLLGDIHGNFNKLQKIIYSFKGTTIQLGDLGIGFPYQKINPKYFFDNEQPYFITELSNFECNREQIVFIRGNHDNPSTCKNHKNYLGDYGVYKNMFYVSGSYSVDKAERTVGVNWWEDEELSISQGYKVLDKYEIAKPKIVLSHDCPSSILNLIYAKPIPTRTGQLLESMLNIHAPRHWYFAHHHQSIKIEFKNCMFQCLNINEVVKI